MRCTAGVTFSTLLDPCQCGGIRTSELGRKPESPPPI